MINWSTQGWLLITPQTVCLGQGIFSKPMIYRANFNLIEVYNVEGLNS